MKKQPNSTPVRELHIILLLIFFCISVQAQHITLSTYTNQTEIKASGSITLTPGFHIPSGNTVRIFIESTLPSFQSCTPLAWSPSSNQNYIRTRIFKVPNVNAGNIDAARTTCDVNQVVQYFDGLGRPLQEVTVQGSPLFKDLVQPFTYDAFGRETTKYLPYVDVSGAANGSYKSNALTSGQGVKGFYSNPPSGVKGNAYPYSVSVIEPSPLNRVLEQGAPGQAWQPASSRTTTIGRTVVNEYTTNVSGDNVRLWTVTSTGATGTNFSSANRLYKYVTKDENWVSGKAATTEEYRDSENRVVLKKIWRTESVSLSTYYVYDDLGNLRYVIPPAVTATSFLESDAVFTDYIYGYHYDGRNRITEKKIPGKGWEYLVYNKLDQVVMTQDAIQRSKANQEWSVFKYDVFGRVIITGIFTHTSSGANTSFLTTMQGNVDGQSSPWENKSGSGDGYTTNLSYPGTALSILSVMYYDDYAAPSMPYNRTGSYSRMTKGLPTASKVQVLGAPSTYLWTVNYYDDKAQLVRLYKQHYKSGGIDTTNHDEITNVYSFAGELTASTRLHKVGAAITTVATSYEYDHMGRKKAVFEKINSGDEIVLSKLDYNEIGQLSKKSLHSTDGTAFLQNTRYGYNERGWLKRGISDQFSMKLGYDTLSNRQFNGNIATQAWGTGSSFPNLFSYTYDNLNRLTSGLSSGTVANSLSEVLTYDDMGNITTMNRAGAGISTYDYTGYGNKLKSITGASVSTGVYQYNVNGNVESDGRLGVTVGYNHLNLPSTVTKSGMSLSYTYDASGTKLKKTEPFTGVLRDYIDGVEYNNNIIDIIHTEEGVARNNAGVYSYEYNLTDHLGNVRYTFNKHPSTGLIQELQKNDYFPFGKAVGSTGINKYLYNGKELQEELGQLDYGARFYDPVIGRWNLVDPKAELLEMSSPYVYSLNSPVNFIDKDGELPIYINGKTSNDSERGAAIYWNTQLLRTIASSGIPNPGGTVHYVDGNRYLYRLANDVRVKNSGMIEGQTAEGRREAGYKIGKEDFQNILSQLARDPKTGKITEKIQIYTHSRGAAFGAGYTDALLEMIKQNSSQFADANHVIDYVLNMAPHQSDAIDAPEGANSFSIDHGWDMLSGDDMGNNTGFKTNTAAGSPGLSHQNKTFAREVGAFIQSFQKSNGNNNQLIDDFVKQMRSYGIKVTVN